MSGFWTEPLKSVRKKSANKDSDGEKVPFFRLADSFFKRKKEDPAWGESLGKGAWVEYIRKLAIEDQKRWPGENPSASNWMANAQQTPAARASSEYPGHPVPTQLNHPTLPMSNGLSNMLANRSVASGSGSRVQTLM